MVKYDWKKEISKFRNDIGEYLQKRYDDYCKDTNEYSVDGEDWYRCQNKEKHYNKQDRLIKFGFKLRDKLKKYPEVIRKHVFEEIGIPTHIEIERYFKDKHDELLKKYNNEDLLKQKEEFEQRTFIKNIDKFTAELKRIGKETDKREAAEEIERKKKIKEEAKRNILIKRRKGLFSNVKPLIFYEEILDFFEEHDIYFQENGKPEGEWVEDRRLGKYWIGDRSFSDKENEKYILTDNPDDNQKLVDRCEEMVNILLILKDSEDNQLILLRIKTSQKYLINGYLITRQIASFNKKLIQRLIKELSTNPYNPNQRIKNHPCKEYNFSIYKDGFDIKEIKEDIDEFIRINEQNLFTPFEMLKVYLKKHNNRITIEDYELFTKNTNIVARKILNDFTKENKLQWKKEGSNHELVYFI